MTRSVGLRRHWWIFQLLLIAAGAIVVCSLCVVAVDRPLVEFIHLNAKPEWLFVAQIIATASIGAPFLFLFVLIFRYESMGEERASRNRILALVISVSVAILSHPGSMP